MKTICTTIAEMTFEEEESILHIRMLEGADMTVEATKAHYETIHKLTGGKEYLALIDASEYFSICPEALKLTSLPEIIGKRRAAAHYNPSFGNKLTADFFRKNFPLPIPLQIFQTKEEALGWLRLQR